MDVKVCTYQRCTWSMFTFMYFNTLVNHCFLIHSIGRAWVAQSVWWPGCGLDGWGSVLGRVSEGIFSLHYHIQTSSRAYPTSCQMDIGGFLLGGRSSWGVKLTTHLFLVLRLTNQEPISPLPNLSHGMVLKRRNNFTCTLYGTEKVYIQIEIVLNVHMLGSIHILNTLIYYTYN
jgi:hypothetical protein